MKKLFLLLMTAGMVSCSSCTKDHQVEPQPPTQITDASVDQDVPQSTKTVSGSGWSFDLPSQDWSVQSSDLPDGAVVLVNDKLKNIVVCLREDFNGATQDYALLSLRGLKQSGATLVSTSQVNINGTTFTLIESVKNTVRAFVWVAVKNKSGYGFSCGGDDTANTQKALCTGISNTLKIQ